MNTRSTLRRRHHRRGHVRPRRRHPVGALRPEGVHLRTAQRRRRAQQLLQHRRSQIRRGPARDDELRAAGRERHAAHEAAAPAPHRARRVRAVRAEAVARGLRTAGRDVAAVHERLRGLRGGGRPEVPRPDRRLPPARRARARPTTMSRSTRNPSPHARWSAST